MADNPATGPATTQDHGEAIAGMMDQNGHIPIETTEALESQPEQDNQEAEVEAQAETETPDPEPEIEAEAAPAEEEAEVEVEEAEAEPEEEEEPEFHTITVDGEELKVSLDALREGHMRLTDYRNKTTELAQDRQRFGEAVEATKTGLMQQLGEANQLVETLKTQVGQETEDLDRILAEEGIDAFTLAKHRNDKRVDAVKAAEAEQGKLVQQRQAEFHQQAQEYRAAEHKKVGEWWPEYGDPKTTQKSWDELTDYLTGHGYTPEFLQQNFVESRLVKIARKAMLYDKAQAAKPEVRKALAQTPKKAKPGTSRRQSASGDAFKANLSRAQKSGSLHDYGKLFENDF